MTKIAIVGFGFMGRMHYGNWKKIRGVKVVAICDANLARLTETTKGNLSGIDETTDFTGIAVYDDFGKMIAAGGFDAVDITLPTPLHPTMSIAALKAGYHVLCEKPMALTTKDCDRMLRAAADAKRTLLVAHCLRFWPEYVALRKILLSGKYGAVIAADFSRGSNPPDPNGPHGWFLDARKSGGCILDMHIHDADMIAWLFGCPTSVSAWTHLRANGVLDHAQMRYVYPDKLVTSTVSWAHAASMGFESSFRVTLERATIVCDARRKDPFLVYPAKGRPFAPKIGKMNGYEGEQRYFLDLVAGRVKEPVLTAKEARDAIACIEKAKRTVARGV